MKNDGRDHNSIYIPVLRDIGRAFELDFEIETITGARLKQPFQGAVCGDEQGTICIAGRGSVAN
jgi:hypothetical protein